MRKEPAVPWTARQHGQVPTDAGHAKDPQQEQCKKAADHNSRPLAFFVVRPKRFELLAYRFVACCSIQLSYERMFEILRYPAVPVKDK